MCRMRRIGLGALTLAGLLVIALAGVPALAKAKALPEKVQEALKAAFPSAKVGKGEIVDRHGLEVWDVEIKDEKTKKMVAVTAEGTIVSARWAMKMKEFPAAAADAIEKAAEGGKAKDTEKVECRAEVTLVKEGDKEVGKATRLDTPKILYQARLERKKEAAEIAVDAEGKVVTEPKWQSKAEMKKEAKAEEKKGKEKVEEKKAEEPKAEEKK